MAVVTSRKHRLWNRMLVALVFLVLVIYLLPLYWMVRSSIAENDQMYGTTIEFFPKKFTLAQFDAAINKWKFGMFLGNSIAVGLVTTILTTVMATLAAYSLARLRYPGRGFLAGTFFLAYIFPATLLVVPVFVILSVLGLTDDYIGLVMSYLIFTVPFCTWMLRAYLTSIPPELEEAALVDGANRVQAMMLIILPLAAPGVAAAGRLDGARGRLSADRLRHSPRSLDALGRLRGDARQGHRRLLARARALRDVRGGSDRAPARHHPAGIRGERAPRLPAPSRARREP